MKKIRLGNSTLDISVLGLGTMYFGSRVGEKSSFRLLDMYVDRGGNFIDTANKYASWLPGFEGGESERLIGKWLKQRSCRADLVISSKVGFPYGDVPRSLGKAVIISECEKSLNRLGIESIDLYYAHAFDEQTPAEETMDAFYQLKREGKIRYAGASNYLSWRLEEANLAASFTGWEGFCCLQQRHTLLEPSSRAAFGGQFFLTPEITDYCLNRNLTLISYSPLLGGVYNHEDPVIPASYRSPASEQHLKALRSISRRTGHTPNQLVLAWMAHSIPRVVPLVTASLAWQMEENLKADSIELSSEEMKALNLPVIEPDS